MFEELGEEFGGSLYGRCPGTGCDQWEAAAGDYDYKVETDVCGGCRDCGGNPPEPESVQNAECTMHNEDDADPEPDADEDEIVDLVNDIADIVDWENAGLQTDWSHYPFETKKLVQLWRSTEREVAAIQNTRMQIFLKSWFKEK